MMIKVLVKANHQKPTVIHIFNEDESGKFTHTVTEACSCQPVMEPVNVGEGLICVHRSLEALPQKGLNTVFCLKNQVDRSSEPRIAANLI